MTTAKTRECPTCGEMRSGRAFKNSDQCTDCRRDRSRCHPPPGCNLCGKLFGPDLFHFEKTGRGWRKECKACHGRSQHDFYQDIENKPPKVCKVCGETKAATDFNGPRMTCRRCKAKQDKQKAALMPKADPDELSSPEECTRCSKTMQPSDLTFRQDTHHGSFRPLCKSCLARATDGSSHSQNCRKRQQQREDYPDTKRHRNETHQQWLAANPGKPAIYQARYRADADCKMRQIIQSAKQRGIDVVQEDVPAMEASLLDPCFYCGYLPAVRQPLNGLDRVDSLRGYSRSNTVPCCAACNHIRGPYHLTFFIQHVARIAGRRLPVERIGSSYIDQAFRQQCSRGKQKAEKGDHLTQDERINLLSATCYLCGQGPAMGIDRVDSSGNYDRGNSRSCCVVCNYMKSSVPLEHFASKTQEIAARTEYWVLPEFNAASPVGCRRLEPVEVLNAGRLIAQFPSRSRAAKLLGVTLTTISNNIDKEYRGGRWQDLDIHTYLNRAPLEKSVVAGFFRQAFLSQPLKRPVSERLSSVRRRKGEGRAVVSEDGSSHRFESQAAVARYLGCSQAAVSKAPNPWRYKGFEISKL